MLSLLPNKTDGKNHPPRYNYARPSKRNLVASLLVAALNDVTLAIGTVSDILDHPTLAPFYESYNPRHQTLLPHQHQWPRLRLRLHF